VVIPPLTDEEIQYEQELRESLSLEGILRRDFKFAREQGLFFFEFDAPVFWDHTFYLPRTDLLEQIFPYFRY